MDDLKTLSQCFLCKNALKSPKRLVCGHSFCQACLKTYLEEQQGKPSYPCPICSYVIPADPVVDSNYIASLPDDETAQEFILAKDENVECKSHLRADIDSYCKTCMVHLCVLCRQEGHSDCDVIRLDSETNVVFEETKDSLLKKFKQMVTELTDTHSALLPKGRQLLMKKEQTALGISDYFSDLRQKVTQYLIQQEQKVQEDLDNLVSLEKDLLQEDLKFCTSLLEEIEHKLTTFKKICGELDKISETSALRICTGMNGHLNHLDAVRTKLSTESPETRFIINTELEDALTSTDLIKIEVINTRQYDQRQDACAMADANDSAQAQSEQEREDSCDSSSSPESSETETDSDEENEEIPNTNVFIEISNTEEPPPPYPGVVLDQTPAELAGTVKDQTPNQSVQMKPSLSEVISGNSPRAFLHLRPVPSAPPTIMDSPDGSSMSSDDRRRSVSPRPVGYAISGRPQIEDDRSPLPQRRHHQPQLQQSVDRTQSRGRPGTHLRLQMCWKAASTAIGDMKPPRIFGLSWIDPEYLLLADRWNHRLKVIHSSGNVVHVFSLGNFQPWDIASMPNRYSAIAIPEAKMIYVMLYVNRNLSSGRRSPQSEVTPSLPIIPPIRLLLEQRCLSSSLLRVSIF